MLVTNKKQPAAKRRTFTECPVKIYIKNNDKKIKSFTQNN